MTLIDTHAHLDAERFDDDRDAVIARAREAGVAATVAIADSISSARKTITLASNQDGIHPTAGVHPHNAEQWGPEAEEDLRALLAERESHGIVAVGETGLEHHYDFAPRDRQAEAFAVHLRLAKEFDLPVVVHCREAAQDVVRMIGDAQDGGLRGVVHCFAEGLDTARRLIDLGFHLGIGGMVTFKSAEGLRTVVREIGLDRVVVETDAPYMAPVPHRGKRNEPAFVAHTASKIAEVVGMSEDDVAEITTRNAKELFRLDLTTGDTGSTG